MGAASENVYRRYPDRLKNTGITGAPDACARRNGPSGTGQGAPARRVSRVFSLGGGRSIWIAITSFARSLARSVRAVAGLLPDAYTTSTPERFRSSST